MNTRDARQIDEQARDWFTLMQSGEASAAQRSALSSWLSEDERHHRTYREYERIWQDLATLADTGEGGRLRRSTQNRAPVPRLLRQVWDSIAGLRRIMSPTAVAFAVICVLVALIVTPPVFEPEPPAMTEYRTSTGKVAELTLADGSDITLGAGSRIQAWETDSERRVRLVEGEAFFAVTKNPKKPFLVETGSTLVRVVGTKFNVHRGVRQVEVAVLEGRVLVTAHTGKGGASDKALLGRGEQVSSLENGILSPISRVPLAELASWRKGRLIYKSAPLEEVIADVNRYYPGTIVLADDSLARAPVTLSLSTDRVAALPEMLSSTTPSVRSYRSNNRTVITRAEDN